MKDSKNYIFLNLDSKLLESLDISLVYNNSKMFRERMVIGGMIYVSDITGAKGGPSLSSFIPPYVTVK